MNYFAIFSNILKTNIKEYIQTDHAYIFIIKLGLDTMLYVYCYFFLI